MADPYIGEIRIVGFDYAPKGWVFCNGQLLQINVFQQLYSLLGTRFGGDGRTTFAVPDLRGRVPLSMGHGTGLQNYTIGQRGGFETVTLTREQLPQHNHMMNINNQDANQTDPTNQILSVVNDGSGRPPALYPAYSNAASNGRLSPNAIAPAGNGQAHDNLQPFLAVNFIIAVDGIFPSRP